MILYLFILIHLSVDAVLVSGLKDELGIESVFGRVIASSRRKRNFHRNAFGGEKGHEEFPIQYNFRGDQKFESSLAEMLFSYDMSSHYQSTSLSYSYEPFLRPAVDDTEVLTSPPSRAPTVNANILQSSHPTKSPMTSNFAISSHEGRTPTASNSSDKNIEENSTMSMATDPAVESKTSTVSSTTLKDGETTLFFTCEKNGQISAKTIDPKNGLLSSNDVFNINYSYSVVSATEGTDFVTNLETNIIDTMASSILDCNGVENRKLRDHDQQQNQRVLMAINSLKYTDSAPLLNALGQCGGNSNDQSYCFGIDSTATILYSNENLETNIIDIAINALREVQKTMNNNVYTDKIPSLNKVALLRSSPEIPPLQGAVLVNNDETNPLQVSPKSSLEPEPKEATKKMNTPSSVITKTALGVMVVGLALLGWVGGHRRLSSRQGQNHVELVDEGEDDENNLFSRHEGVSAPELYLKRSSHIHRTT